MIFSGKNRLKRITGLFLCVILCVLTVPSTGFESSAKVTAESIKQKEAQIEQQKKERESLKSAKTDLEKIKKELETSKSNLNKYIKELDDELSAIQERIAQLEEEITKKEEQIEETTRELIAECGRMSFLTDEEREQIYIQDELMYKEILKGEDDVHVQS